MHLAESENSCNSDEVPVDRRQQSIYFGALRPLNPREDACESVADLEKMWYCPTGLDKEDGLLGFLRRNITLHGKPGGPYVADLEHCAGSRFLNYLRFNDSSLVHSALNHNRSKLVVIGTALREKSRDAGLLKMLDNLENSKTLQLAHFYGTAVAHQTADKESAEQNRLLSYLKNSDQPDYRQITPLNVIKCKLSDIKHDKKITLSQDPEIEIDVFGPVLDVDAIKKDLNAGANPAHIAEVLCKQVNIAAYYGLNNLMLNALWNAYTQGACDKLEFKALRSELTDMFNLIEEGFMQSITLDGMDSELLRKVECDALMEYYTVSSSQTDTAEEFSHKVPGITQNILEVMENYADAHNIEIPRELRNYIPERAPREPVVYMTDIMEKTADVKMHETIKAFYENENNERVLESANSHRDSGGTLQA